jgi:hypothetical protein
MKISKLGNTEYLYTITPNHFAFFDDVVIVGLIVHLNLRGVHTMSVYKPDQVEFLEQWKAINNELP